VGIPVLFTDSPSTPDIVVKPRSGLWLSGELYLSDDLFLDEGPDAQAIAVAPAVGAFGVTVSVDAANATASGGDVVPVGATDFVIAVVGAVAHAQGGALATAGQDLVLPVVAAVAHASATIPESSGGQLLILVPSVRELPPLRLHHTIVTPSGRHFRWGEDDPNPANVPSNVRFSDTMPGGFETGDATLPRRSGQDSSDFERLSTWTIRGAGGEVAWEGRIERAPSSSGDERSVSPSGVGWQAHLDDNKSAQQVYVDADLSAWRGPGAARQASLDGASPNPFNVSGPSTEADTAGPPALGLTVSGAWTAPRLPLVEAWYDAGSATKVAAVVFLPSYSSAVGLSDPNWTLIPHVVDGETSGSITSGTDVYPATTAQAFFPATPRRFGLLQWFYVVTPAGGDGIDYTTWLRGITVVGDHGLTVRADPTSALGLYASDVVAHAVQRWAPQLNVSTGPIGTVRSSSFVIPHLTFKDPTTSSEIVRQSTRFGLQDWAVWEGKTFWWHDRGARGRKWRARVGPSQLSETGPSLDRLWNSIIVQYDDVDGSTRTVGPPGSGADVETTVLQDLDPSNPANEMGIIRRDLLQMGTSTPAAATEVGRRFLEQTKLLDGSGQAQFVGHVMDDHGVTWPYWAPRAGDSVVFVDGSDTSERRVVRTEKDHSSRTCSVDLDAPPQGLEALLERLGVVLVPLGIN
jgi:hypothetical protein